MTYNKSILGRPNHHYSRLTPNRFQLTLRGEDDLHLVEFLTNLGNVHSLFTDDQSVEAALDDDVALRYVLHLTLHLEKLPLETHYALFGTHDLHRGGLVVRRERYEDAVLALDPGEQTVVSVRWCHGHTDN